jgi:hypothetical protein
MLIVYEVMCEYYFQTFSCKLLEANKQYLLN